jgi:hypothetical protein
MTRDNETVREPDHAVMKILALLDEGKLLPEKIAEVLVRHESTCPRPWAGGPCKCDPEIKIAPTGKVREPS